MKSSSQITPDDQDERYVWSFDQRDIDNPNQNVYTKLVYRERVGGIISLIG